jgi:DNA polymerase I
VAGVELVGDNRGVGDLVTGLGQAGVRGGDLVGLVVADDGSAVVAYRDREWRASAGEIARADAEVRPRWVVWSQETARWLVAAGVRVGSCWDVAAVHRVLSGGWRADPGYVWACLHGAEAPPLPGAVRADDLFTAAADAAAGDAVAADAVAGDAAAADAAAGDAASGLREYRGLQEYGARRAVEAAELQRAGVDQGAGGGVRVATIRSESTVELLCAELAADGLPVDRETAENLLSTMVGRRPRGAAEAAAIRAERDAAVLRHAPAGVSADLRSTVQVRSLLAAAGIDVPDTRAWRLEEYKERSPLVAALLDWRKAERIATTYGYGWLDEHLGPDGRLRGAWTGCDGAAGRMTASSGLHNMPAVLRQAVLAEGGHVFVRADLGQIEPRVLAAVSGDAGLIDATAADDMYLPVAAALGVDRPTAKVAMIAAMYGQTTGHGGEAGRRMRAAYPVAMGYLDTADRTARAGRDLRTYGGRLVRMSDGGEAESAARKAARGRYGRNAMIQGAAAELFKMWAVTVRARGAALDARIVLCLHDELLVHVPAARGDEAAALVSDCLAETARRWAPGGRDRVRFIADIGVLRCWAEAKG